jgi:hypothetical protein
MQLGSRQWKRSYRTHIIKQVPDKANTLEIEKCCTPKKVSDLREHKI